MSGKECSDVSTPAIFDYWCLQARVSPKDTGKVEPRDVPSAAAIPPRQQPTSEKDNRPAVKAPGSSRDIHFDATRTSDWAPAKEASR